MELFHMEVFNPIIRDRGEFMVKLDNIRDIVLPLGLVVDQEETTIDIQGTCFIFNPLPDLRDVQYFITAKHCVFPYKSNEIGKADNTTIMFRYFDPNDQVDFHYWSRREMRQTFKIDWSEVGGYDLALIPNYSPKCMNKERGIIVHRHYSKISQIKQGSVHLLGYPKRGHCNLLDLETIHPIKLNGTIKGTHIKEFIIKIEVPSGQYGLSQMDGLSGGPVIGYNNGIPYIIGVAVEQYGTEIIAHSLDPILTYLACVNKKLKREEEFSRRISVFEHECTNDR